MKNIIEYEDLSKILRETIVKLSQYENIYISYNELGEFNLKIVHCDIKDEQE